MTRAYLSIGDVLSLLRAEFPDVTISKIRFLESQGLVNPERSPSGYRKFYEEDVERLRWVLRQQREHFLPLKVIRDRLARDGTPADLSHDEPADLSHDEAAGLSYDEAADLSHDETADLSEDGRPLVTAAIRNGERRSAVDPERPRPALFRAVGATGPAKTSPGSTGSGASINLAQGSPAADTGASGSHGSTVSPASHGSPGSPGSHGSPVSPGAVGREPVAMAGEGPAGGAERPFQPAPPPVTSVPPVRSVAAVSPGIGPFSGMQAGGSAGDPGGQDAQTGHGGNPEGSVSVSSGSPGATAPVPRVAALSGASFTLEELSAASGMTVADVAALEGFGLIESLSVAGVVYYDEEALVVAKLAAQFASYGIEPRHLRLYRNAVEREVGLVEQIITPLLRQRNPEARQRAMDASDDLARLGQALRSSLLRRELQRQLGR